MMTFKQLEAFFWVVQAGGNTIVIDHGGGKSTLYAHQSRFAGSVGQTVTSGTVIGFPVLVADFHVESRTGFDRDFSATRAPDGAWQAVFNVPPGQTYDVRLDAFSRDGRSVSSPTRRVDVSPAANRLEPPAPDVAPTLAILFPAAEAVQDDPFDVSVRIGNATAVGMIFEIKDAAGDLRRLEASPADTAGLWTAPFTAVPGDYDLSVRASLENGFVQNFSEHRAFRILAATGTPANP